MEFPITFLSHTFSETQREWSMTEWEACGVYYAITKWNYYLQGTDIIIRNDHQPLAKVLNGKNANNKVTIWGLEPAINNITFEWISGAKNKAPDYLSCLVELPSMPSASINIVSVYNKNRPAFNTRSQTQQCIASDQSTAQQHVTPDIMLTSDPTPKSLTSERLEALLQMQKTDPFCKPISKCLSNGKAPKHEMDLFIHVKGLLYKHITNSGQKFLALVIPKSWKYMVLVEANDKLGHQGNTCTCRLIKCQYYWKGMNKVIHKYIANCALCHGEKAKIQNYPLQMMEIPNRPFDKIAIDLVTECKTSTSGNKHILTIIDHLTEWPEAFPIPDKSANTIVSTFINKYNNLMDQVLKQLGIEQIFSAPYYPQGNGKLDIFHKYLKLTLKKLCEKDPSNWDQYPNHVLASYRVTPNLATAEMPFFLVYGRDPNLPLHQILESMQ